MISKSTKGKVERIETEIDTNGKAILIPSS